MKTANNKFSNPVSKIKQPIKVMFSWFIEKTDIQRASKVRSTMELILYAFGKLSTDFSITFYICYNLKYVNLYVLKKGH